MTQTQAVESIAPPTAPCKCCAGTANLAGVVDFSKNCEEPRGLLLPLTGIPIYYHRCAACGLLFTIAFDHFTQEDFGRYIYNEEYARVDPDYAQKRPSDNAQVIAPLFQEHSGTLRILDYGGGNGAFASHLRRRGFADVHTYDPFVPEHSQRPQGLFDVICSFEVLEHSPTPRQTLADMISLLKQPGLILVSTLVQPPEIEQIGVRWWYLSPRNGHVSLYTRNSLSALAEPHGYKCGSFSDTTHVFVREIPSFAKKWFAP